MTVKDAMNVLGARVLVGEEHLTGKCAAPAVRI